MSAGMLTDCVYGENYFDCIVDFEVFYFYWCSETEQNLLLFISPSLMSACMRFERDSLLPRLASALA